VNPAGAALARVLTATVGRQVVAPPGEGTGYWAGAPSAVHVEGQIWLAYRLRRPVGAGRGYANVIARSPDGEHFETVATVFSDTFGCDSLERPALLQLPDGSWRLYVSCATRGSKHWWVEALDAPDPEKLPVGERRMVLPGDRLTAWKDPVVQRRGNRWQMWACQHPLGDDAEADRMQTWYATSGDGISWTMHGPVITPAPGTWDARGSRASAVLDDLIFYDGRPSAAENWEERTGIATLAGTKLAGPLGERSIRYLSIVELPGGYRLYWEATVSHGAHDLRTEYVPRPVSRTQSA
jgi:hypothetical protein